MDDRLVLVLDEFVFVVFEWVVDSNMGFAPIISGSFTGSAAAAGDRMIRVSDKWMNVEIGRE